MKLKYLLTFCLFFCFTNINAQDKIIINPNAPEITFEKELIDMGTYNQFDDDWYTFNLPFFDDTIKVTYDLPPYSGTFFVDNFEIR